MTELVKQLVNDLEIKMTKYILFKIRLERDFNYRTYNEYVATFTTCKDGIKGIEQNIKEDLLNFYYCYDNLNELNENERKDFEKISEYISWAGTIELFKFSNKIHIGTYNCNGYGTNDTLKEESYCNLKIDSLEEHYYDNIDRKRFTLKGVLNS